MRKKTGNIIDTKTIIAIIVAILFIYLIYLLKNGKKNYSSYTSDRLLKFDNIWYWTWDKQNNITMLHSKCTNCGETLVYDDNTNLHKIHFYCPKCNSQEMTFDGQSYSDIQNILKSEIKRKAYMKFHLKKK